MMTSKFAQLKKPLLGILPILSLLHLSACNKGFENANSAVAATGSGTSSSTASYDAALDTISYKGIQTQGDSVGRLVLELDRSNEALILILPLPTQILTSLGQLNNQSIPGLPGAQLLTRSDGRLAVSVPLKYVVRNGSFKNKAFDNMLPNGDKLPAFPAGEGAGFSLEIVRKYKINLYIGVSAAAVFIETPDWNSVLNCDSLGLPICPPIGPFEVRNQSSQDVIGYVSLIYAKQNFNSGAFVSAQFPDSLARFIDDHVKY